ncbi:MAG: deoxyribose-phosphate aldolase [Synergistaceae bacterium]|jgi:deoxyribose-phosphate aldolase|nr:deoxyribose-phosphate aldolase [Synergistaceae bacterium]
MDITKKQLAGMMDHTLLAAAATPDRVEDACREALQIGAASVCVNPANVSMASALLRGSGVKVCTVIGFPLGANTPETKAFETRDAVSRGAQEVDMVINIGALKAGLHDEVLNDIRSVVGAAGGAAVKVIIETCCLSDEEKVTACRLAAEAGADFVKTSTGFGTGGANPHDVALMKANIPKCMRVKASGGMRTWDDVRPNLEAGADRLGVSASVAILESFEGWIGHGVSNGSRSWHAEREGHDYGRAWGGERNRV